jgi:hypothetical protein
MAAAGNAAEDRTKGAVAAGNAMTRGRKDAAVLTPAQFTTLQLSSVVAAILEAINAA